MQFDGSKVVFASACQLSRVFCVSGVSCHVCCHASVVCPLFGLAVVFVCGYLLGLQVADLLLDGQGQFNLRGDRHLSWWWRG